MTKINFHQKVIIENNEGNFLALKASYKGLKWDLPGGAVDFPELHDAALEREVKEETGLEIQNIVPLEVQTAYNKIDDEYVIFIGYRCIALSEKVSISGEHSEHIWLDKNKFLELDATQYLKDFVNKFL